MLDIERVEGPFYFGTHVEGVPDGAQLAFGPSGEDGLPDKEFLVYMRSEAMTNAKGPRFERLVRDYLNEVSLHAERTGPELADEGDIHFGAVKEEGEWTIEAKDHAEIDLPGYLRQLEASLARRDSIPFKAAAVVKNRRHGAEESYAVMRLERFRQLAAYVMVLELEIMEMTGNVLSLPEELRTYLGRLVADTRNANLLPAFAEFGTAREAEVREDGTEVPAGGQVCACGEVHTPEELAEVEAFILALLGLAPAPETPETFPVDPAEMADSPLSE